MRMRPLGRTGIPVTPDPDDCVRILHRALDAGIDFIVTALEGSLRRLGVDHIDVYQVHHPEPGTDTEEVSAALTVLMRPGKVRAISHSSMPAAGSMKARCADSMPVPAGYYGCAQTKAQYQGKWQTSATCSSRYVSSHGRMRAITAAPFFAACTAGSARTPRP